MAGKNWKTSRRDIQSYRASDDVPVVYIYRGEEERVQVAGPLCREDGDLMASAPALLEALERIARNDCGCHPVCRCNTEEALRVWKEAVQEIATAAVSAAKGER